MLLTQVPEAVIRLSKRILIVDDNDVARNLLIEAIASRADWQVCGAAIDGKDAIQKAATLKPDLIVMDMAMPVMDGLQAAKEILKTTPALPIILNTMHTGEQVSIAAQSLGIRKVISKTAGPGELEATIEKLLNPPELRVAAGATGSNSASAKSAVPIVALADPPAADPSIAAQHGSPADVSTASEANQASSPKPQ